MMMGDVKLTPIAAESLGVRSFSFFVETPDVKILVDPGVSLGRRFSRPPHLKEYQALKKFRSKLVDYAKKADVLTVSHYHFDHFTPIGLTDYVWTWNCPELSCELYDDKELLVKDAERNINFNQRRRGAIFLKHAARLASKVEYADGRRFEYGATKLTFSPPVPHGEDGTALGWVLMLMVRRGDECVAFSSDVQGPVSMVALSLLLSWAPGTLALGGPPLYLAKARLSSNVAESAIENMIRLARVCNTLIIDHHVLRDEGWRAYLTAVFSEAERKAHQVLTAAEYLGNNVNPLEFYRKALWEEEPPPEEFVKWCKMPYEKRKLTPPPVD